MTCLVCDSVTEHTIDECEHRICEECLQTHCRIAVRDGNHEIPCPAHNCSHDIAYAVAIRFLDESGVRRLDRLIVDAAQLDDEEREDEDRRRNNDNDDDREKETRCGSCRTLCDIRESDDTFYCDVCRTRYCCKCGEEEHYRCIDCAFYEVEEAVLKEGEDSKRCPRCRIYIQKYDGCDCVRCPHCKCKFCWNCLMRYKRMDSVDSHRERCEHFSAFNDDEQSDADSE